MPQIYIVVEWLLLRKLVVNSLNGGSKHIQYQINKAERSFHSPLLKVI
jgi:hypothetical protein